MNFSVNFLLICRIWSGLPCLRK